MNLTKPMLTLRRGIVKNSPTILTILGSTGVIITAISAGKDALKADQVMYKYEYDLVKDLHSGDSLPKISLLDKTKIIWKCYIPTAILGVLTIGCIVASNMVSSKRNSALISAYSLASVALKEYQEKVVEAVGANKERSIRDKVAQEQIIKNPIKGEDEIYDTGHGETRCYESWGGRYFKSDIEFIRSARNELNDLFLKDQFGQFMSLNDVYYAFGLQPTDMGNYLGWHLSDGILELTFTSCLDEKERPCLSIGYKTQPRYFNID